MFPNPFAVTPKQPAPPPTDAASDELDPDDARDLEIIETERAMLATSRDLCTASSSMAAAQTGEQVIPMLLQEARALYFAVTGRGSEDADA